MAMDPNQSNRALALGIRRAAALGSGLCLLAAASVLALGRTPEYEEWAFFGSWPRKWVLLSLALVWLGLAGASLAAPLRLFFAFVMGNLMLAAVWFLLELAGAIGLVNYGKLFGFSPASGLGYTAIPHADVSGETIGNIAHAWGFDDPPSYRYHFRTDRRGYRNDVDWESGEVICLGDSFVVSGLVPYRATVSAGLERALDRSVVNVALIGIGPQQQRDMLRASGLPLEGRLVLHFLFEGNDLADSRRYRRRAEARKAGPSGAQQRLLATHVLDALRKASLPSPAGQRVGELGGRDVYFLENTIVPPGLAPEIEAIGTTLREIRDEVEAAGGSYRVVLFPVKLRAMGAHVRWPGDTEIKLDQELSDLPERLAQEAGERGIPFLDLGPTLEAMTAQGEVTFFADDTHLNASGHRAVVRALLEWEPLRAWKASHSSTP
ncbi:MAG: hypothetical protein GY937_28605 [bacterium]|nr:hypothetical protein [bacterium]